MLRVSHQINANNTGEKKRSNLTLFMIITLIVIILYFLSIAPVTALMFKTGIIFDETANKIYEIIYSPILYLEESTPYIHGFYRWWFGVFGIRALTS